MLNEILEDDFVVYKSLQVIIDAHLIGNNTESIDMESLLLEIMVCRCINGNPIEILDHYASNIKNKKLLGQELVNWCNTSYNKGDNFTCWEQSRLALRFSRTNNQRLALYR